MTNRSPHSATLIFFSVVDLEGKNQIVFVAFVSNETKETYVQILQDFKKAHTQSPGVIISDHDKALTLAIEEVLPTTSHLLCHWHIRLNIIKNIGWLNNPRIKLDTLTSNDAKLLFRRILNLLTCDREEVFEKEVKEIQVSLNGTSAITYFQELINFKDKWALFMISRFTAASTITSRAESVNSECKLFF